MALFKSTIFLVGIISIFCSNNIARASQPAGNGPKHGNQPAKLHHVLVNSCFSYSHCLEVFGVALTLVDTGRFEATVFVPEACRVLAARMLEVTRFPKHIRTINADMAPEPKRGMMEIMSMFMKSGLLTNTTVGTPKIGMFSKMLNYNDDFFRRDNYSAARQVHDKKPFHVAICDAFSPACFEFADQQGIVGITAGVQGPPTAKDVEHNGLWLAACPRATNGAHCSFWDRVAMFYDYFFPYDLPLARRRQQIDLTPMLHEVAVEARKGRHDMPPVRPQYPHIDQQVLGTVKPAAYYRPDHAIVGPAWLSLHQQELNASHPLTNWLERASKPVVYVSFGSMTQLNKTEVRIILEGAVSDRWQTIWKTNTNLIKEILSEDEKAADNILSSKTRALASDGDTLHAVDWAAQYALLRHPKVKAFVTHGGAGSTLEAYATGKPVVCIPLFGDQPYNCKQAQELGTGVMLQKPGVSSKALRESIERLLFSEPTFTARAANIAQYHATVNTSRRLLEFVSQYAEFKYQFSEIADDHYDVVTYWNLDLWALVGATLSALTAMMVLIACKVSQAVGGKSTKRDRALDKPQPNQGKKPATVSVVRNTPVASLSATVDGEEKSTIRHRRDRI